MKIPWDKIDPELVVSVNNLSTNTIYRTTVAKFDISQFEIVRESAGIDQISYMPVVCVVVKDKS